MCDFGNMIRITGLSCIVSLIIVIHHSVKQTHLSGIFGAVMGFAKLNEITHDPHQVGTRHVEPIQGTCLDQ